MPRTSLQVVCSNYKCAIEFANQVEEKVNRERKAKAEKAARADRAETKKRLLEFKRRPYWVARAQKAFNAYIRERDKYELCICCDKPLGENAIGGAYDCGHYRSVGSASHMRFDEQNAHAQRKECNYHVEGRTVEYRIGLIKRIGIEAVERVETTNAIVKLTIDDIKNIEKKYKAKKRELEKDTSRKGAFF